MLLLFQIWSDLEGAAGSWKGGGVSKMEPPSGSAAPSLDNAVYNFVS